ncbi:MAG: lipoyl(octanoyl) transferase LipB [Ginsengibacter sp.]
MDKQQVHFKDLGIIDYKAAWDYQEKLVNENVAVKRELREQSIVNSQWAMGNGQNTNNDPSPLSNYQLSTLNYQLSTTNHLIFCEHSPVYTLGKSGSMKNVLLSEAEMDEREIEFFKTNRGGDITFHGLQQVVGYPILDLEKFYTDIGKYLRNLEEVIILTLAEFNIEGERSKGETGVWIQPGVFGKERKICAMGIRCSRWITMHGFALNVNTDLSYFDNIIPCGIQNKQVTSMEKELGYKVNFEEVKRKLKDNFEKVFDVKII